MARTGRRAAPRRRRRPDGLPHRRLPRGDRPAHPAGGPGRDPRPSSRPTSARRCWRSSRPATLAKALEELDSDDAADVVDDLDEAKRDRVLAAMPAHERTAIEASLAYEDETAGRLMQREVALAPQFWTVGQAMDHLSRESDGAAGAVLRPLRGRPGDAAGRRRAGQPPAARQARDAADRDHGAGHRDPGRHGPGGGRLHLRQVPPDLRAGDRAGRTAGGPDHRRRHRRRHPGRERRGHAGAGQRVRRRPRRLDGRHRPLAPAVAGGQPGQRDGGGRAPSPSSRTRWPRSSPWRCCCRSSPRWATTPASRPWPSPCARWRRANSTPPTPGA